MGEFGDLGKDEKAPDWSLRNGTGSQQEKECKAGYMVDPWSGQD